MADKELCKKFGTTLEDVERDVEEFENGDWSSFKFGTSIEGRPKVVMRQVSMRIPDYELAAIDRAASAANMTRSEFMRKAAAHAAVVLA